MLLLTKIDNLTILKVAKRIETNKDTKEIMAAFEEVWKEQQKVVEEPALKKKPSKGQKDNAEYLLVWILFPC